MLHRPTPAPFKSPLDDLDTMTYRQILEATYRALVDLTGRERSV